MCDLSDREDSPLSSPRSPARSPTTSESVSDRRHGQEPSSVRKKSLSTGPFLCVVNHLSQELAQQRGLRDEQQKSESLGQKRGDLLRGSSPSDSRHGRATGMKSGADVQPLEQARRNGKSLLFSEMTATATHALTKQLANTSVIAPGSEECTRFLRQHELAAEIGDAFRLILDQDDLRDWLLNDLGSPMPEGAGLQALRKEFGPLHDATDVEIAESCAGFVRRLAISYAEDRTMFGWETHHLPTEMWPARHQQTLALFPSWVAEWHDGVVLASSYSPPQLAALASSALDAHTSPPAPTRSSSSIKSSTTASSPATELERRRRSRPSSISSHVSETGRDERVAATWRKESTASEAQSSRTTPSSRRSTALGTADERSSKKQRTGTKDNRGDEVSHMMKDSGPSWLNVLHFALSKPSTASQPVDRYGPQLQSGASRATVASTASTSPSKRLTLMKDVLRSVKTIPEKLLHDPPAWQSFWPLFTVRPFSPALPLLHADDKRIQQLGNEGILFSADVTEKEAAKVMHELVAFGLTKVRGDGEAWDLLRNLALDAQRALRSS